MKVEEANAIVVVPEGFCPSPDLLPVVPESITDVDPVGYMATVLNRAKGWLVEAQSIEAVRDAKAVALGYETVIREKELAFDAQLSATEIVRRCERRIGQLVHEGQERGEIRTRGQHAVVQRVEQLGPVEAAGVTHKSQVVPMSTMASVPDEDFDQAIEEAKAEGNLSRANVVRKVKGETKPSAPMPPGMRRSPRRDPAQTCREAVTHITGLMELTSRLGWASVPLDEAPGLARDLEVARRSLSRIIRELKGATT